MSDFDLRKFLSENKLTSYSKLVNESRIPAAFDEAIEEEDVYRPDMEEGNYDYQIEEEEVINDEEEVEEGRNLMEYESVDAMIKEIEYEASRQAMEYKISEVRKSCKRLEEELHSLEESDHAHMISASKMNKMRKDERKLKKTHEKYLSEYVKKYGN